MRLCVVLLGIALFELAGCYKTSVIPATELGALANCGTGDCILMDSEWDETLLDDRAEVTIVRNGQRMPPQRFTSLHLQAGSLIGITTNGEHIEVPVASIQQLVVRRLSVGRTLAVILIPIAVFTLMMVIFAHSAFGSLSG
jgi:hypothetical protein